MIVCNFFFILSSFRNTEPPSVIIGMCTWKVHSTSPFGSIIRLQVRVHFRHCKKLIWKKFVLVANTLTVPTTIFKKIQVMIFYSVSARTWAEDWFVQPSSFSDQEMAWFSLGLVRDRSPVRDVANLWIPESRRRTDRFRRNHKISSNYLFFVCAPSLSPFGVFGTTRCIFDNRQSERQWLPEGERERRMGEMNGLLHIWHPWRRILLSGWFWVRDWAETKKTFSFLWWHA